MPGDRKRREHSSSYPSTDKPPSGRTPSTHSSTDMWNGGQSTQAGWLNAILRDAEEDYDFNQLSVSGTVTLSRNGAIAVFTPDHAADHSAGLNQGTMSKPNLRFRESLEQFLAPTPTAAAPPAGEITPAAGPTPAQAAPTPESKPPTMLQARLGELADGYKISAEMIEKKDLEYLNFLLDGIESLRMRELLVG